MEISTKANRNFPSQRKKSSYVRALILSIFFFFSSQGWSEEEHSFPESSHVVVLPAGSVYQGDYFAWGNSVEISGEVKGDVYVLANQIIIDGTVQGDVIVAGGSVDISGTVAHSVRCLGGQVLISGNIGNSVTVVAGNVQLLGSATVGSNVVLTAGNVDLSATIGSNVTVVASNLRISSSIANRIQAYVGQLRITSKAQIGGEIDYRSTSSAWIDPGAVIKGQVVHHTSLVHELVEGTWIQGLLVGGKVVALLMNFAYTWVVGLILIKMFPKNLDSALHVLKFRPWKAFSWGLMLLILLPLAALILLMTILGAPFALTLIAANIIGFYTAKIYSVLGMTNWLFTKLKLRVNRLLLLTFGLMLYFSLTSLPFLGVVLACAAMLFGLGAGTLAQARRIPHSTA